MSKIRFGLIGSGWRAEFYIRIAKALPEMFDLAAVMIRSKEKGEAFSAKFGVKVVNTLDELVEKYDFLTARRGMGLMQGIVCEKPVGQVSAKALEEGLILITAGSDVLRIVPPLIIEKEHVDEMVEKLEKVFQKMK